MNTPLPIDRLPHQPPMRWLQTALRISGNEIAAEAMLPVECGEEGTAPVLLGLEILAQAAGVLLAASIESSDQSTEGRLIQVNAARWKTDRLPVATAIEAKVKRLDSSAIGLHRFAGTLTVPPAGVVVEAEFSLLVPAG